MSRKPRSTAAALVFASLLVPAAFAQNRPSHPAPVQTVGVWEWLIGMFVPTSTVDTSGRGIVAKEGSQMDPDGAPKKEGIFSPMATTDGRFKVRVNGIK
jgi:hypothetical protein